MQIKNPELHAILHKLWTKAVNTPDYVKAEWILLEQLILKLQSDAGFLEDEKKRK